MRELFSVFGFLKSSWKIIYSVNFWMSELQAGDSNIYHSDTAKVQEIYSKIKAAIESGALPYKVYLQKVKQMLSRLFTLKTCAQSVCLQTRCNTDFHQLWRGRNREFDISLSRTSHPPGTTSTPRARAISSSNRCPEDKWRWSARGTTIYPTYY